MLQHARSLADQIYDVIVEEICDGALAPGDHLVQERLAERFGVSRQPIQQTMNRLRADGIVEEVGKRGLFVARLDIEAMQHHYGVRAALDGWASQQAARELAGQAASRLSFQRRSEEIFAAADLAMTAANIAELVALDERFHALIYETSANPLIAETAAPHWRFLRRALGDVLRKVHDPEVSWRQHREIADIILAGDGRGALQAAESHAARAARRLAATMAETAE